jgi:hypothetical protein
MMYTEYSNIFYLYLVLHASVVCFTLLLCALFLDPAIAGVESQSNSTPYLRTAEDPETSTTPQESWGVVIRYVYPLIIATLGIKRVAYATLFVQLWIFLLTLSHSL